MLKEIKRSPDVAEFIATAENMIAKYGWQDKTVHPYSFPMKVTKIIEDLKDYDRCTEESKDYLIALANGLAPIMNSWEEYEHAEKITVRIKKSGKITKILASDLEMFADLVEAI